MNWDAVIEALDATWKGAEVAMKATDDPVRQLEARIISGVAASLSNAFSQGMDRSNDQQKKRQAILEHRR